MSSNASTTPLRLVLLPGLDGTGRLFEPVLQALGGALACRVLDYPRNQMLGYAELVPRVRAALPDTPFVLLGESFGGPLALQLAATAPPGLAGVILSASFVRCPHAWATGWSAPLVRSALFRLYPHWSRMRAVLGAYSSDAVAQLARAAIDEVAPQVLAHRVREVVRVDARSALAACPVPLLYLQGARDWVVPAGNLRRIQALHAGVRAQRFDSGHLVLQEQPDEGAAAILRFCAALRR